MSKKNVVDEAFAEETQGVDFGDGDSNTALIVDLNEVEDGGFEPLPRGMYECEVTNLEFTISQRSGNPMWAWELEVVEGEYAGRKLFFHTVWAGNGLAITKQTIKRVAPELMQGPINPEEVADQGILIGRRVRARVDIRKYEGENRNNVRGLFASEGGSGGEDFLS